MRTTDEVYISPSAGMVDHLNVVRLYRYCHLQIGETVRICQSKTFVNSRDKWGNTFLVLPYTIPQINTPKTVYRLSIPQR